MAEAEAEQLDKEAAAEEDIVGGEYEMRARIDKMDRAALEEYGATLQRLFRENRDNLAAIESMQVDIAHGGHGVGSCRS